MCIATKLVCDIPIYGNGYSYSTRLSLVYTPYYLLGMGDIDIPLLQSKIIMIIASTVYVLKIPIEMSKYL